MARLSRQQSQELTRQRLRLAARNEFALHGIQAASIDKISEAAGYSRGAFYANYENKRELALEILREVIDFEINIWKDLINSAVDSKSVYPIFEQRFEEFTKDRARWLLSAELLIEAERDPEFGKIYRNYSQEIIEKLRPLVIGLIDKSSPSKPIDPDLVSIAIRTLSHGLMFENYGLDSNEGNTKGKILTQLLERILS